MRKLGMLAMVVLLCSAAQPRDAVAEEPAIADLTRSTEFAVFAFFSFCVASFGDYRAIPAEVLNDFKAEKLPPSELREGDVVGWRLHGPASERATLKAAEPGEGCHVESARVDPTDLHDLVEGGLGLISKKRSIPYRLSGERRWERQSVAIWRRTYMMAERNTPTVAIMVTAAERSVNGMQGLLSYMFVSDPF